MKKIITRMLAMFMILAMITIACKEEEPDPNVTPTWLLPYQGLYSGTYDGDDTGTWTFTIVNSFEFEMFVTSDSDNSTYSRVVTLNEQGIFSFSGPEILLGGLITGHYEVSGSWEELEDNTGGDFIGHKQ